MHTFSWRRLLLGIGVGSTCALVLAWLLSPEAASRITLNRSYEGPRSVTKTLLLYDIAFSFLAFLAGSFISYFIAKSKPYWACFAVGIIGWLVYYLEAGGISGIFSGEYPLWYEFAPTHLGSSFLASWLIIRRKHET